MGNPNKHLPLIVKFDRETSYRKINGEFKEVVNNEITSPIAIKINQILDILESNGLLRTK